MVDYPRASPIEYEFCTHSCSHCYQMDISTSSSRLRAREQEDMLRYFGPTETASKTGYRRVAMTQCVVYTLYCVGMENSTRREKGKLRMISQNALRAKQLLSSAHLQNQQLLSLLWPSHPARDCFRDVMEEMNCHIFPNPMFKHIPWARSTHPCMPTDAL